ncbi:MAG: PIN domain-containing protein [Oscillospiraceae bacterium]|nr:PIN domain-containing protein [Oscillospiraceae bacterium]
MRVLLDTNIILDFFLSRAPHYEAAKRIFELTCHGQLEAYTTSSSITDIYYIVAKKLGDRAAREVLRDLFSLLGIIAVDGDDCIYALELPISDYEDAVVTICAKKPRSIL